MPALLVAIVMACAATRTPAPAVDAFAETLAEAPSATSARMVTTEHLPEAGLTAWTLSNGATVWVLPRNDRSGRVQVSARRTLDATSVSANDRAAARMAEGVVRGSGLGPFDADAVDRFEATRQASARMSLTDGYANVSAEGPSTDLEAPLALLSLHFRAPRVAPDALRDSLKLARRPIALPELTLLELVQGALWEGVPDEPDATVEPTPQQIEHVLRQTFADAGAFTFFVVGDITPAAAETPVLRWIGDLPGSPRDPITAPLSPAARPVTGPRDTTVHGNPYDDAYVVLRLLGPATRGPKERQEVHALVDALEVRLRYTLPVRTPKEARTPGVGVLFLPAPTAGTEVRVTFRCDAANMDATLAAATRAVEDLRARPVDAQELGRLQAASAARTPKSHIDWMHELRQSVLDDADPASLAEWRAMRALTPERVQGAAERWLDLKTRVVVRAVR